MPRGRIVADSGSILPNIRAKREYVSRNCRWFKRRCLDPPDSGGGRSASSGTTGRSDCVLSIRPTMRRAPESGFTVAAETADTIGEGHAEAGHDQSGNVGGRGSTVPRFESPNRPARQAVPPLRQAGRVLHALHLETAGQPGTAPRPLLPVPSRGARRLAELRDPRSVDLGRRRSFFDGPTVRCDVTAGNRFRRGGGTISDLSWKAGESSNVHDKARRPSPDHRFRPRPAPRRGVAG